MCWRACFGDTLPGISHKETVAFLSDLPCFSTKLNLSLKQLLGGGLHWEKCALFLFWMICRFTKPQAELYQAVLDIQKSCLSLCSPGVSLENIYSLMLSLIGQKLKDLGILKGSITDSHFFKVHKGYFNPASPHCDCCICRLCGFSLDQKYAFEANLLIIPT